MGFRWWICGLLFAATTLNDIDRQVLGVLAPDLGRIIGWNELQYGYIVTAFQGAYAIGLVCAGAIIDRVGVRIGYALAIAVWSLAAISRSFATTSRPLCCRSRPIACGSQWASSGSLPQRTRDGL